MPPLSISVTARHRRGNRLSAMEGYGSSGRLHTTRLMELGENLPVRIEIIDSRERIEALLPQLDEMIPQGLMTIAEVRTRR